MKKVTFQGGVHPSDQKQFSRDIPFSVYEPKGDLVFPVAQHIGAPASPVVKKGDEVLAGQIIAEATGFVSANIISSCSGKVKSIEKRTTATGAKVQSIVIENDGDVPLFSRYNAVQLHVLRFCLAKDLLRLFLAVWIDPFHVAPKLFRFIGKFNFYRF